MSSPPPAMCLFSTFLLPLNTHVLYASLSNIFFRTTHKDFANQEIKIGDARLTTWFECVYLEGVFF